MFRPEYSEVDGGRCCEGRLRTAFHGVLMLALLAGTLAIFPGCTSWDKMMGQLRGPGFGDNEDSEYMAKMREKEDLGETWSFSTKGQQIERSFGS